MIPILPKRELMLIGGLYRDMSAILAAPPEKLVARKEEVSLWNPIQQIRHVGWANAAIFERLLLIADGAGEGIVLTGGPRFAGWITLTLCFIKKGVAKSPQHLVPEPNCTLEQATEAFEKSKRALAAIAPRLDAITASKARFTHPRLGSLNGSQWLKFARIHTNHHVRIAEKVLNAAQG